MSDLNIKKNYNKNNNGNAELVFTSAMVSGSQVKFFAFLTSFTQQYSSEWNVQNIYGRIDPVANFRGNIRTLNLAWDVPASDQSEAEENLKKFETLTQMIYPSYSKSGQEIESTSISSNALSLSKSPLIRLKFANLIADSSGKQKDGLLGYVTSLSWNPVLEMGMFTSNGLYPKVVSLNITYGVLHEHDLGFFPDGSSNQTPSSFPFGG